jgi:hypothetical protein
VWALTLAIGTGRIGGAVALSRLDAALVGLSWAPGLAAAVITADLSLLSNAGAKPLQSSGLAHLLSVSGL